MEPSSNPDIDSDSIGFKFPPLEPSANSDLWDWGDLLDFSIAEEDDQPLLPLNQPPPEAGVSVELPADTQEKVRKRDPRNSCFNFLAGKVPCSCPELDALEEEEADTPLKKRVRGDRSVWAVVKCQVSGCEADISQLKGYHKRHKVCLSCAKASSVVVDGETKRYCQQCGKFHVMSDFDEGKRSCRRKLERHNNRRRRKPIESKVKMDSEPSMQTTETVCDGDNENVSQASSIEKENVVKPENMMIAENPTRLEDSNGECGTSYADPAKVDSKLSLSPSTCDDKTTYSSQYPTGRISFKFYEWNPAEFPRRLRDEIFQWLSNMPVELEGYIRPGCTILTAFIAMPRSMWVKLLDDPLMYIHDLCVAPGNNFSGKGPVLIYVNNIICQITHEGNSLMKVDAKKNAPKLHYVYPSCFEAGRPMEIFACGSNFSQHKFQFLVSFEGRYLNYASCTPLPCLNDENIGDEHQIYRVSIPQTDPHRFGPAFIEVENASGLSNFHPILICDKEVCREVRAIQKAFDVSNTAKSGANQMTCSDFLMDVAWLLKKPSPDSVEHLKTPSSVQRITTLFSLLRSYGSTSTLKRIARNLDGAMSEFDSSLETQTLGEQLRLALDIVDNPTFQHVDQSNRDRDECMIEELEVGFRRKDDAISKLAIMKRCRRGPIRLLTSRLTIMSVALVAVCCVICAVIIHPSEVTRFAVAVNRCWTHRFNSFNSSL